MKFHRFHKIWRRQRETELDAEIRSHLDSAIRDRIERGESPDEARANALREFGNMGLVKEVTREIWGWATLERLGQDLRFTSSLTHRHNRLASEWHSQGLVIAVKRDVGVGAILRAATTSAG
jgi:hypothetical protein